LSPGAVDNVGCRDLKIETVSTCWLILWMQLYP